ncbi:maleylpyruvate isomerase family mycothiol-dependent enzyme [Actinokineospora soli]|uniref:Maleylpyruvate isomerase family mycothiol-dependent enzyme n=1 Tax=Actinokineospora soli TaxID=1048753 RepID=A0ABW2TQI3_9PSEU
MTRSTATSAPADRAATALDAVRAATEPLLAAVAGLDQRALAGPSLLPGWTRGHVVTHLARNADALVNLLTWARTGIEHPAYPSRADRDADIHAGHDRMARVQREDLIAAGERFLHEASRLDADAWGATLFHPSGRPITAAEVPELRLFEMCVHGVDLDAGIGFADLEPIELLLEIAVRARGEGPVTLVADLPDGRQASFALAGTAATEVRGPAAAVLAWLTDRGPASALSGEPPALEPWG